MNRNKAIRLIVGLFIAPFIIPIPIAAFILWDSLGHWRTTALSFSEYYHFPLVFLGYYLAIVVSAEILLAGLLTLISRWRLKKEMKRKPQPAGGAYFLPGVQKIRSPVTLGLTITGMKWMAGDSASGQRDGEPSPKANGEKLRAMFRRQAGP